jgi:hypothetical protein
MERDARNWREWLSIVSTLGGGGGLLYEGYYKLRPLHSQNTFSKGYACNIYVIQKNRKVKKKKHKKLYQ